MKYLLKLSYLGTAYAGFQVQPNGDTVQGRLCSAAKTLFGVDGAVTGCSRTDSGVHAKEYYATLEAVGGADIPAKRLPRAINTYLPKDISVSCALIVPDDFSIRKNVVGKEYEYIILNTAVGDPFYTGRALHYSHHLDADKMNEAAKHFVGKHDFAAFMASGSDIADTVRTVSECRAERDGDIVKIYMAADGFLYNMVRITVGTLIEVSEGKISPDGIDKIINSKDRTLAGRTAPPEGLYLGKVFLK